MKGLNLFHMRSVSVITKSIVKKKLQMCSGSQDSGSFWYANYVGSYEYLLYIYLKSAVLLNIWREHADADPPRSTRTDEVRFLGNRVLTPFHLFGLASAWVISCWFPTPWPRPYQDLTKLRKLRCYQQHCRSQPRTSGFIIRQFQPETKTN